MRRSETSSGGSPTSRSTAVELSLLSVHPQLIGLAEALLGAEDLRVYSIEGWAKYTGAAGYDQEHHRDYLNQTMVVPTSDPRFRQVEMFLYLTDVPRELGPPSFVPRHSTTKLPALPNWYPRTENTPPVDHPSWVAAYGSPSLYDAEVSGEGPAGTVAAYRTDTFHRGTALTQPRGVRCTLHVNFRPVAADWGTAGAGSNRPMKMHGTGSSGGRIHASSSCSGSPPGHPYWTAETLAGVAERYPTLDLTPWRR